MTLKWHKLPPYPVQYCLVTDWSQAEAWAKKNKIPIMPPDKSNLGGVFACGSYFFVYINPKQPQWDLIVTVIHEGIHVFDGVMQYINETTIGGEVRAYTTSSIIVNLMKDFDAYQGTLGKNV